MIVVTGASGKLGGAVVERLLERAPADQIVASVRNPDSVSELSARGVEVRRGDYDDPRTLADAFAGADQLLLVSASTTGPEAHDRLRGAIAAAREAGVGRIVYTAHMGASPTSAFAPMPDHADTEAALRESGVSFTSLRNGFYAATVPMLLGPALETGEIVAPADGPVSWTTHADLAEAAAIVLTEPDRFDGPTPALTGPESVDLADVAAIASDLTGREIRRVVVADDAWREQLVAHGTPEPVADMLLGMFVASRHGEFAAVDPTLAAMLGRRPQTVRDVLAAQVAAATR